MDPNAPGEEIIREVQMVQQPIYIKEPVYMEKEVIVEKPTPVMVQSPSKRAYHSKVEKSPYRQKPIKTQKSYVAPKAYKKPVVYEVEEEEIEEITEVIENVRQVKDVSYDERSEAIIGGSDHWQNYYPSRLNLDEVDANKLDINYPGDKLYATGKNGTAVVNIGSGPKQKFGGGKRNRRGGHIKCSPTDEIIIMEPGTNDAYITDLDVQERTRIEGFHEKEGKKSYFYIILVPEDFRHYRHSLDDYYMLWKSGQDNLSIIDVDIFQKRETIKEFFTFGNKSSMPICACSDRTAEKIVAISQPRQDFYVIHYYEDSKNGFKAFAKPVHEIFPNGKNYNYN